YRSGVRRLARIGGVIMARRFAALVGAVLVLVLVGGPAAAVDVVKGGKPVATVVSDAKPVEPKAKGKGKKQAAAPAGGDAAATALLVSWGKKMTDAELPVADKAPAGGPAIYVGRAAVRAGLKLDDIDSQSNEG